MRLLLLASVFSAAAFAADKPNILWLTAEDHGPHLGCYGDKYANTPTLDALAARGMIYTRAWSCAPVCAPARTCLISARWAPSDGAEHMRSEVPMPAGHQMYPQLLRAAGYYCTNNAKEDYNLTKPADVWDNSSKNAHWKNRKEGQPFFAIFNHEQTHESKIRARPHTLVHDAAKAPLPPYHPDTPEVRHDWAQYYDNLTTVDGLVAKRLAEIEEAGLAENTIVFYYADHGPGMPRSKRWPYNSGLHVPLIAYFPPKWKHLAPTGYAAGSKNPELVCFLDLPPTLLSLAGIAPPDYFQGRAFAGAHAKPAPEFVFGFRGRMDERYDMVRSATDGRFVYLRHYMPHLPYGQYLDYMFAQATTRVWHDLFTAGKTNELQSRFWREKPSEELYDLQSDPWETVNLAADPAHRATLEKMRAAQEKMLVERRDLGFIPEAERLAAADGKSPKDAFASEEIYPIKEVLAAANLAADRSQPDAAALVPLLSHRSSIVRYWAVMGHLVRGSDAVRANTAKLEPLLADPSASVRIAVAETLAGQPAATAALIAAANPKDRPYVETLEALNVIDRHFAQLSADHPKIKALPAEPPAGVPSRLKEYIRRLHEHIRGQVQ